MLAGCIVPIRRGGTLSREGAERDTITTSPSFFGQKTCTLEYTSSSRLWHPEWRRINRAVRASWLFRTTVGIARPVHCQCSLRLTNRTATAIVPSHPTLSPVYGSMGESSVLSKVSSVAVLSEDCLETSLSVLT
jgi:hypothetical protein